ncbi:MAG TPA: hypothetical protein VEB22_02470, partial [Phycisphaerales bacterium]|nr:hypothetical protein [Phycisphaerales bacterium]
MLIGVRQTASAGGLAGHEYAPGTVTDRVRAWAAAFTAGLLGLGVVGAVVVVGVALLSAAKPVWWREGAPPVAGGLDRSTLAGALDNGAWTVVTEVRPMAVDPAGPPQAVSEPWSVSLTADSASAWLSEKLPRWVEAQGRSAMIPRDAELQAAFDAGVIKLGARLPGPAGGDRFLSLAVRPRIDGEGLWLPASSASVGRLSVPLATVLSEAQGELAEVLRGDRPALSGA